MDNRPIGIFDSGMGGLTVRAAIARALPNESLVYFGDGANVPYGPRPREEIISFVDEAAGRLIERNGVKMMIIACNAATGAAIDHLRVRYDIPIIGMEPAVKPAALTTKTKVIGILATAAAFQGELYRATSARYRDTVRIIETVGEGFVELVENDREETLEAFETVRRAVHPMLEAGADRIVLGCTHYPFLAGQIRRVIDEWIEKSAEERIAGPALSKNGVHNIINPSFAKTEIGPAKAEIEVHILDSTPAIVRRTEQLLAEKNLHTDPENTPQHEFLTFADEGYLEHLICKNESAPNLINFS